MRTITLSIAMDELSGQKPWARHEKYADGSQRWFVNLWRLIVSFGLGAS